MDNLPKGMVRACAGVVECVMFSSEQMSDHVRESVILAGEVVGKGFTAEAELCRQHLVDAIRFNLANRRDYPIAALTRHFGLPVSEWTFIREKQLYCAELARRMMMTR